MATGFFRWSKTPGSNASATYTWAEGMAPSAVNDSARGIMSDVAQWRDDIGGLLTTTTSTSAYVLTSNSAYDSLANLHGMLIAFTPHGTNTNTVGNDVTLAVDGLTAKPIRAIPSVPLPTGSLIQGTPYLVVYNNTDGAFYLHGMANPYSVPLASGFDYWGSSTPNTAFAFPAGQAISRTTYAALFAIMGTTYGTGDGSTTFNLPDKTGRISAMKESSATRLTSSYFSGNSTALGAVGGSESTTLTASQIPSITSANANQAINVTLTSYVRYSASPPVEQSLQSGVGGFGSVSVMTDGAPAASGNNNISVTSNNTSGQAHRTVQPTIICNYIIRVL